MTTLNFTQTNTLINSVAGALVKSQSVAPRQALAVGTVFTSCVNDLLNSSEEFVFQFENRMLDVKVDGDNAELSPLYILTVLIEHGFIEFLLDTDFLVAGRRTCEILDLDTSSYAPYPKGEAIQRRRGYAKTQVSPLFKEAVHALESSEYEGCKWMLDIAREVYKLANPEQRELIMVQDYVLKGTAAMVDGKGYTSEFFGDLRGRLYQASCFGPNGQSSDLARAMMDLHGVSKDYNNEEVMELLIQEMMDMGDFLDKGQLMWDIGLAVQTPAEFVLNHMEKLNHISKPWNFTKFALIYSELEAGNKPYVGVTIGLDAKCSGPQLGACMVADQKMLAATGFSEDKVNDAYHNALEICEQNGIQGLDRALIKKPFMAVFYGANSPAMMDANTITARTYHALYSGMTLEGMEDKSKVFHDCIVKSFGPALNKVRASIKQAGYDYDNEVTKFNKPLRYSMPDGFEVAMDYRYKLDVNGEHAHIGGESRVVVENMFDTKVFKNMVFTTDEYDLPSFARTGFVNMIQATDALLARLIIVHVKRMGAQHIIAVHDCFRVNIHDMAILKKAIIYSYRDLFCGMKNKPTEDLPLGTDILGLYFDGNKEATKDEYRDEAPHHSQFFSNGTRYLRAVNGVRFINLVNKLGKTYYFDK